MTTKEETNTRQSSKRQCHIMCDKLCALRCREKGSRVLASGPTSLHLLRHLLWNVSDVMLHGESDLLNLWMRLQSSHERFEHAKNGTEDLFLLESSASSFFTFTESAKPLTFHCRRFRRLETKCFYSAILQSPLNASGTSERC